METLLVYLFKANVFFAALFGAYYLLLRKAKFLQLNRLILLMIGVGAFLLPVLPGFSTDWLINRSISFSGLPKLYSMVGMDKASNAVLNASRTRYNAVPVCIITLYGAVMFILLVRLFNRLRAIMQTVNNSKPIKSAGIVYCEAGAEMPPFSFFNFIFVRHNFPDSESYTNIITHELCHCREWHSMDVLFADLTSILLWVNPLAWIYKTKLKLNLEFLADQGTLNTGIDVKSYQLQLLSVALNSPVHALASTFHSKSVKQRISMMNSNIPAPYIRFNYLLLILIAILLEVMLNSPAVRSTVRSINVLKATENLAAEVKTHISIDARTNTVKFKKAADREGLTPAFKGIYVLEGKVYTDQQLRDAMDPAGSMDLILPRQPIIGIFTPMDKYAIKKWGTAAKSGVIFIQSRTGM